MSDGYYVNVGSWPKCCKAAILYDFGHCSDSPGSPTTEELSKKIAYNLHSGYYAVRVALLVQEQVPYAEKALLDNGFFLVSIARNESGRKIFTYVRPTDDVYHVEVDREQVGVSIDEEEEEYYDDEPYEE